MGRLFDLTTKAPQPAADGEVLVQRLDLGGQFRRRKTSKENR